ncbi:hypothetical protein Prudu_021299 [Prunus dulcis]|uniref:Uncharacterized protein n=1 Tax=Prunus dulcis TaxID=3755 RepID=A0A4Y1RYR8_PRUDU|nr:hypothetical protein Prudu_021299 [Prunus dulcis]
MGSQSLRIVELEWLLWTCELLKLLSLDESCGLLIRALESLSGLFFDEPGTLFDGVRANPTGNRNP